MSWGDSWGSRAGSDVRDVAEAFYAGRGRKRKQCRTDGSRYWSQNCLLAERIKDDELPGALISALRNGLALPRRLMFRIPHVNKMIVRHLDGLKLSVELRKEWVERDRPVGSPPGAYPRSGYEDRICSGDHVLPIDTWFAPDDIPSFRTLNERPARTPQRDTRFVNLTLPLFADV